MKDKLCRICWNMNGWRRPSGTSKESGKSFVAEYRFGMEEWLFNYEWCIGGKKFGYLTPIKRFRKTYEGNLFSATLYTRIEGRTLVAAEIRDIYVPTLKELRMASTEFRKRGWLRQMRRDIVAVGADPIGLTESRQPEGKFNICFDPDKVTMFDPMPEIEGNKLMRYHPYDLVSGALGKIEGNDDAENDDDPTRSDHLRKRASQKATIIDPQHVRLQNKLYCALCKQFGAKRVHYERNYVDLMIIEKNGPTYFEIKTDSTARKCIRNALGQLLEYSCYPSDNRATKLIVVGDAPVTEDDKKYLKLLRRQFSLPIHYAQFNWEKGNIGKLV